jgi:membrane dipeptidase
METAKRSGFRSMVSRDPPSSSVVDVHIDTLSKLLKSKRVNLHSDSNGRHVDIPKLRRGGVKAAVFAAYVPDNCGRESPSIIAMKEIDIAYRLEQQYPDDLKVVRSRGELIRAARRGIIGMILSIENGIALEGSLELLRVYYRLGVRALGLTWNGSNALATGTGGHARDRGLTSFGRNVVAEMERLGMMIDVSHLSRKGFWDVVNETQGPLIASHSNAAALCDHGRNIDNDQIKAIGARGGFIGVNFHTPFLTEGNRASVADVVNHISHIGKLAGNGVVGIGSDFDGTRTVPQALRNASMFPQLKAELKRAGFSSRQIDDITGNNFLRVMKRVCG